MIWQTCWKQSTASFLLCHLLNISFRGRIEHRSWCSDAALKWVADERARCGDWLPKPPSPRRTKDHSSKTLHRVKVMNSWHLANATRVHNLHSFSYVPWRLSWLLPCRGCILWIALHILMWRGVSRALLGWKSIYVGNMLLESWDHALYFLNLNLFHSIMIAVCLSTRN